MSKAECKLAHDAVQLNPTIYINTSLNNIQYKLYKTLEFVFTYIYVILNVCCKLI